MQKDKPLKDKLIDTHEALFRLTDECEHLGSYLDGLATLCSGNKEASPEHLYFIIQKAAEWAHDMSDAAFNIRSNIDAAIK